MDSTLVELNHLVDEDSLSILEANER